MKSSHKLLLGLAFIPYLAGAGYFQMAEFANNRVQSEPETLVSALNKLETAGLANGTLGEIRMFAGNFAPRGWVFCEGQSLPISRYSSLYSIMGTIYGGNGVSDFVLPDLRGRVAVGAGSTQGLSPIAMGKKWGQEVSNLRQQWIPTVDPRTEGLPEGMIGYATVPSDSMFYTHQPSLAVRYIICIEGDYPQRN